MHSSLPVSVLMVISPADRPDHYCQSITSISEQINPPQELVVVYNGKISSEIYALTGLLSPILNIIAISFPHVQPFGYALSTALPYCSTKYIARHDPDDIMLPDRILKQYNYITKSNIDVLGSSAILITHSGQKLNHSHSTPSELIPTTLWRNPFFHPSIMFKKEALIRSGGYSWMPRAQDYELWFRLQNNGLKMANLEEPLIYYRIPVNKSKRSFQSAMRQFLVLVSLVSTYKKPYFWIFRYLPILLKPFLPPRIWSLLTR